MPFSSTEVIIEELKAGRVVVLTDDEDRENEGDLVALADRVTPEQINFMLREARGLLCLSLSADICDQLDLSVLTRGAAARHGATAFTETIDAVQGITTGVSAQDRWETIRAAIAPSAKPRDLLRPGHMQPIRARRGGVLVRPGHTEGSVDLARFCGAREAAVIIEIMNENGSMARLPDLIHYVERHGLKMGSIADLIEYRRRHERLIRRVASAPFPTPWGDFEAHVYRSPYDKQPHIALTRGIELGDDDRPGPAITEPVLGRVHAENFLGDVFGSSKKGQRGEVERALGRLGREDRCFFLYMRQEDRGADLEDRLRSLVTGDEDRGEAPPMDARNYGTGAQILGDLGLRKIKLLSNSSTRRRSISGYDLEIVAREPFPD